METNLVHLWTKQEASVDAPPDHPCYAAVAGRAELDLEDGPAAKLGGIQANNSYPADFLLDNLKIQTNVIETAWRSGVRRLLFLGSSLHLPQVRRAADPRRSAAHRAARAHQRVVCDRQDHRNQAV